MIKLKLSYIALAFIFIIYSASTVSSFSLDRIKDDENSIACTLSSTSKNTCYNSSDNEVICGSIELCMNYLANETNQNNKINTTILVIPDGYVTCPISSYQLPASSLHVFYSNSSSSKGFTCRNQFLNVITTYPTSILFIGLVFNNYQSTTLEGGIIRLQYSPESSSFIPSVSFQNVKVINSESEGLGGSIYSDGYSVNIINSTITSSQSGIGGAVYLTGSYGTTISIYNSVFKSCFSSSLDVQTSGGAIYSGGTGLVYVEGSSFSYNAADYGGAIYATNLYVSNTIFLFNSGLTTGGAIYSTNSSIITNSFFNKNSVFEGAGGAITCLGTECLIQSCIFESNIAGSDAGSVLSMCYHIHDKINNRNK